ncbi:MAG: hypothetical protein H5U17_08130 [Defluviimonas sp.]|nr:hypothetical protein [Defluviimonas sp.]
MTMQIIRRTPSMLAVRAALLFVLAGSSTLISFAATAHSAGCSRSGNCAASRGRAGGAAAGTGLGQKLIRAMADRLEGLRRASAGAEGPR